MKSSFSWSVAYEYIKHSWNHEYEIEALKKGIEDGGFVTSNADREVKIEAPKPPMSKGAREAQEVDNFLWPLENCFNCNKVKAIRIN